MNHHGPTLGPPDWTGLLVAGGALVALVVGALAYLLSLRPGGANSSRHANREPAEAEVLATLWQKGRPVAQSELAESAAADPENVAEAVQNLEARGQIWREWSSKQQDYIVYPE